MKLKIEKLDHFGRGISFLNQKICFIENALPEEVVEVKITKETKKFCLGKPLEYFSTSKDRVKEECPYASICGGCDLEHMTFELENSFKKKKVEELLEKFTPYKREVVKEIIYKNPYYYRNKLTLHSNVHKLGFYQKGSKELIPIQQCRIANHKINELLPEIIKLAEQNTLEEIMIRTSNQEDQVLVKVTGKKPIKETLSNQIDSFSNNFISGKPIISTIGPKKYFLSADSFFQVNEEITKDLYDKVLQIIQEKKAQKVLDLYCGAGTIGLYISDEVESVLGIDSCASAIKDANLNKKLNNTENINFIHAKVEDKIDSLKETIDTVIVDPPRTGLDKKTIFHIIKMKPKQIIYISCDPATLMRDLNILSEDYQLLWIQPFNLFPRTYHVECLSVLIKK